MLPLDFMQLRVLLWRDGEQFVAQCLETGSVATADDYHTLRSMIYGLLNNEVDFNVEGEGSLRNLFDTPAPIDVWQRYYQLSLNRTTDFVSGLTMLDATY